MRVGALLVFAVCRPAPAVVDADEPVPPRLTDRAEPEAEVTRLRVRAVPPKIGDPIELLGDGGMLCARRHGADLACAWDTGLADPTLSKLAGGSRSPQPVALSGFDDIVMTAANDYTGRCLLDEAGAAWCWGEAELWDADFEPLSPRRLPLRGKAIDVAVAHWPCLIIDGRLEHATGSECAEFAGVRDAAKLAASQWAGCVQHRSGTVSCYWRTQGVDLKSVPGLNAPRELAIGDSHACALATDGAVECWGFNDEGQLCAPEAVKSSEEPRPIPRVAKIVRIAASGSESCALRDDGAVLCWGGVFSDTTAEPKPRRVADIGPAVDVALIGPMGCALQTDRRVLCFLKQSALREHSARLSGSVELEGWRDARALWPTEDRARIEAYGARQGFVAHARGMLTSLSFALDAFCKGNPCRKELPPELGPTISASDRTLAGWGHLGVYATAAGIEYKAARRGAGYVFSLAYQGTVFDKPLIVEARCTVREKRLPGKSLQTVDCDTPQVVPAP